MDGLWALAAVVAPLVAAFVGRIMAIDLGYQIRAGAIMLDTRQLLDIDTFTFTIDGQPWLNQQWGAEVLLALIYRSGGWGGIAIVRGLLVGLILALVYRCCRSAGAAPRTAAILTLSAWLVGIDFLPQMRAQLFAFLIFSVLIWMITTRHDAPGRIWFLPGVMIVWANLHGSFPLMFVLLGLAWLEDRRQHPSLARRLMLVALACVPASLINPFGIDAWTYAFHVSTDPHVLRQVIEWRPPTIYTPTGFFFFVSLFATAGLLLRHSEKPDRIQLLTLVLFGSVGLIAIRGVVWWALVAPVVLARVIADAQETRDASRPRSHLVLAGALASLVVATIPWNRGIDPVTGGPAVLSYAPEALVSAADEASAPGTHAFVSGLFSSWTELSAPSLLVALDARIELFPQHVWTDSWIVSDGREGWDDVLERWGVGVLILEATQAEDLLDVLPRHPEWRLIARDPYGAVYVRT